MSLLSLCPDDVPAPSIVQQLLQDQPTLFSSTLLPPEGVDQTNTNYPHLSTERDTDFTPTAVKVKPIEVDCIDFQIPHEVQEDWDRLHHQHLRDYLYGRTDDPFP